MKILWILLYWFLLFLNAFGLVCGRNVTYDGRSLIINGQHKMLFSGSIHYPRSTPEVFYSLCVCVCFFFSYLNSKIIYVIKRLLGIVRFKILKLKFGCRFLFAIKHAHSVFFILISIIFHLKTLKKTEPTQQDSRPKAMILVKQFCAFTVFISYLLSSIFVYRMERIFWVNDESFF